MNIPSFFQSGDTVSWNDTAQLINGISYDSSAYDLSYSLRGASVLDITATANTEGWATTITAAQSTILVAGSYRWAAYLTQTDVRITAGTGDLTIKPNIFALAAGTDIRSFYEKALADTEQAMADFAASGGKPKEYTVADKHYVFNDLKQIQDLAYYWNACVTAENAADQIAQGLGNPRRTFLRFG